MLSIGLMSGTSMDGIDAALLETDGSPQLIKDLGNETLAYAPEFKILLKAAEFTIRQKKGNLAAAEAYFGEALLAYLKQELKLPENQLAPQRAALAAYLSRQTKGNASFSLAAVIEHSTQLHALIVKTLLKKSGYQNKDIAVVGYHGQTFLHQPMNKISIILGNGQDLANDLGIPVVNDFRRQDIEAGGQGAPFAPLYHQALALRDKKLPVAVVNCGGIANITLIRSHQESDLIAFDTGPGNGLIDRLVKQRSGGKENMDENGRYGKQGQINETVFKALYEKALLKDGQNYLLKAPPKSLDIGDLQLLPELAELSLEDACATLEAFTAETIAASLELIAEKLPSQWILAGGGWNNPVIRSELEKRIKARVDHPVKILLANEAGWNAQAMEAQIFAYLAVRSLQKKALSFPGTTGVPHPMSGGQTFFPD